jgi:peptidyl-prolyl cis-trans isomerase C
MGPLLRDITVNGRVIPARTIANEAQNHPAPAGKPGWAWTAAARALAIRELMLDEARARGLSPDPAEIAPGQIETEEEALIRQLLEEAVTPEATDEARLRAIWEAEPHRFRAPSLYEAAHILIPAAPDDPGVRAGALVRAEALAAELARDPRRFAELARTQSACSSAASGGVLGQLSSGDTVPEFEAALAGMAEGTITPAPVATRYGFHLIRLDAKATGAVLPFEAVAPRLRAAEAKAAWVRASRAFVASLVARAEVEGVTMDAA